MYITSKNMFPNEHTYGDANSPDSEHFYGELISNIKNLSNSSNDLIFLTLLCLCISLNLYLN